MIALEGFIGSNPLSIIWNAAPNGVNANNFLAIVEGFFCISAMMGFFLITSFIESLSENNVPNVSLTGLDKLSVSTAFLVGSSVLTAFSPFSFLSFSENPSLDVAVDLLASLIKPDVFLSNAIGLNRSITPNLFSSLIIPLVSLFIRFIIGEFSLAVLTAVLSPIAVAFSPLSAGFDCPSFRGVSFLVDCTIGLLP